MIEIKNKTLINNNNRFNAVHLLIRLRNFVWRLIKIAFANFAIEFIYPVLKYHITNNNKYKLKQTNPLYHERTIQEGEVNNILLNNNQNQWEHIQVSSWLKLP